MLAPAGVVQEKSRERRAPIFQHPNQCSLREIGGRYAICCVATRPSLTAIRASPNKPETGSRQSSQLRPVRLRESQSTSDQRLIEPQQGDLVNLIRLALKLWLGALDDFRNWLIHQAA